MKKTKVIIITAAILLAVAIFIGLNVFFASGALFKKIAKKVVTETGNLVATDVDQAMREALEDMHEIPQSVSPLYEGDVIKLNGFNFRVEGIIEEQPADYETSARYYRDDVEKNISYIIMDDSNDIKETIVNYINGYYTEYKICLGLADTGDYEYYMYDVMDQTVTVLHDVATDKYYTILPMSEQYMIVTADTEFYLTTDKATIIFGNPEENPMTAHTYSTYELGAITNTQAALRKTDAGFVATNTTYSPSTSTNVITYTNESDDKTRAQMAKYGEYKWNSDGTSSDTKVTLDLTSAIAKASQWILASDSTYSWSDNGLSVSGLQATKSAEQFTLKGTVSNLLSTERPWVLVVKLLDDKGGLLSVKVVDMRNMPLAGKQKAEFSVLATAKEDIPVEKIKSIQFDIY